MSEGYEVGRRYLHGKTRLPLTVRYIGPLPPVRPSGSTGTVDESALLHSGPSKPDLWIGVEYDDPSKGKHTGTYEGKHVFEARHEGAGAFIRAKPGALLRGKTFVEAIEERYGAILPPDPDLEHGSADRARSSERAGERLVLGSSEGGIVVEAPNLDRVQRKMSKLESLREIGFEDQWVAELGGDERIHAVLRDRLKGVTMLNLLGSLLPDWSAVVDIVRCLPRLDTLILRFLIPESSGATCLGRIKFLHLGDSNITWDDVITIEPGLQQLETLYLDDNATLRSVSSQQEVPDRLFPSLRILSLAGSPVDDWSKMMSGLAHILTLDSLNISGSRIACVPVRPASAAPLPNLRHLIWSDSALTNWSDPDHLEMWLASGLSSLRFGRIGRDDNSEPQDADAPARAATDESLTARIPLSNDAARPIIIAKFASLTMLNSSPVIPTERRDAESAYVSQVEKLLRTDPSMSASDWGRYEELRVLYGPSQAASAKAPVKATLKSRMMSQSELHIDVQVKGMDTFSIALLPASTTASLRTKIGRKLKVPASEVRVWMAKPSDHYHPWQRDRDRTADNKDPPPDEDTTDQSAVDEDPVASAAMWEKVDEIRNDEAKVGDWCDSGETIVVEVASDDQPDLSEERPRNGRLGLTYV